MIYIFFKISNSDDGLFWISFEDFCQHYRTIDYCRLVNLPGWSLHYFESSWLPMEGGRISLTNTFVLNPQFILNSKSKSCKISLILSQLEVFDGEYSHMIEYKNVYVFKFNDLGINYLNNYNKNTNQYNKLQNKILKNKNVYKKCLTFQNSRDIYLEFTLEQDQPMLIIPCTYDPVTIQTYFTIKIFSTNECELIKCI